MGQAASHEHHDYDDDNEDGLRKSESQVDSDAEKAGQDEHNKSHKYNQNIKQQQQHQHNQDNQDIAKQVHRYNKHKHQHEIVDINPNDDKESCCKRKENDQLEEQDASISRGLGLKFCQNIANPSNWLSLVTKPILASTKSSASANISTTCNSFHKPKSNVQQRQQQVRKLSNVSHRNIQLLSMKPRSERDAFAETLKCRRRSSLINLILGAPSSGPRFCDDLCSLGSRLSNFGIESFPDYNPAIGAPLSSAISPSANALTSATTLGTISSNSVYSPRFGGSLESVNPSKWSSSLDRNSISSVNNLAKQNQINVHSDLIASQNITDKIHLPNLIHKHISTSKNYYNQQHRRRSSDGAIVADFVSSHHDTASDAAHIIRDSTESVKTNIQEQNKDSSLNDYEFNVDEPNPNSVGQQQNDEDKDYNNNDDNSNSNSNNDNIRQLNRPKANLASTALASIDLTSSFEQHLPGCYQSFAHNQYQTSTSSYGYQATHARVADLRNGKTNKRRILPQTRILRRSGSELSLYSTASSASSGRFDDNSSPTFASYCSYPNKTAGNSYIKKPKKANSLQDETSSNNVDHANETKLIIILQVCLPFMLAGFGNMAAGLVLSRVATWNVAKHITTFLVLLPPLVGLKGNIEMTMASRLSTLSNLNLLDTKYRCQKAYISNLVLILSQAIGLGLAAALIAILCECLLSSTIDLNAHAHAHHQHQHQHQHHHNISNQGQNITANQTNHTLSVSSFDNPMTFTFGSQIVLIIASALLTLLACAFLSSMIMSTAILVARLIQVNPDNLSTLVAALYGDVSCVLIYGCIASSIYSIMREGGLLIPCFMIAIILAVWPITFYWAYKFKETREIVLSSLPAMLTSITISMGSGAVLSLVVKKYSLIALYQPVVNGFSANLIAVQASRVSTWLWCRALNTVKITSSTSLSSSGELETSNNDEEKSKDIDSNFEGKNIKATLSQPQFLNQQLSLSKTVDICQDQTMTKDFNLPDKQVEKSYLKTYLSCLKSSLSMVFWSFTNPSPNSIAARLLLVILIPAHTIYFIVIWLLSSTGLHIVLTWSFYLVYLSVCIIQVFILLMLCEPFMTLLMKHGLDPDIFGISILMALADFTGTLCLTGAFELLSLLGDTNAST